MPASARRASEDATHSRPQATAYPATIESAIVRLSDFLAYLGRDVEDAVLLGCISPDELPADAVAVLGNTIRAIINNLVMDVVHNSRPEDGGALSFSKEAHEARQALYAFSFDRIYMSADMAAERRAVRTKLHRLFEVYLDDLRNENRSSLIFGHFLDDMPDAYRAQNSLPRIVADFMAGMTDRYFEREVGCRLIR